MKLPVAGFQFPVPNAPTGHGLQAAGNSGRRGVTLLELVTVIVILALLMGLSVALFRGANRDLGVKASSHHMVALIRAAHDFSRTQGSPSWIVINTNENSVYSLAKETVGEWHFEDTASTGAFNRNARVTDGTLVQGRVGQGMRLRGGSTIDCGDVPVYAKDQGIAIEFWYLRLSSTKRQVICTIGAQVEIAVEATGRLTARVGDLSLSSKDVHLKYADNWYFVQMVYNGREGQLHVNNTLVDSKRQKADWTKNSPLIIGSTKGGVEGVIDEFKVSLIFAKDKFFLPSEAKFEMPPGTRLEDGEFVIRFDSEGRLNPQAPVTFKIKSPTDEKQITIHPTGTVSRK